MEYSSLKKRRVNELQRQQQELKKRLLGKTQIQVSYENGKNKNKEYDKKLKKYFKKNMNKKVIKKEQLKLKQKQLKNSLSKVSIKSFY